MTPSLVLSLELKGQFDIEIPADTASVLPLNSSAKGTTSVTNILIQQAFKESLVRATGKEKVLSSPVVERALSRVDDYVKQFGYHQSATQGRTFRVLFNEIMVADLLHAANFKILPKLNHKPILVWMIISENNTDQWLNGENHRQTFETLNKAAKRLGTDLLFPMLDLTDNNLVSEQNIIKQEFDPIMSASKRYNASAILVGRVSKQLSGWYAEWTIIDNGIKESWDNSQTELNALLADSMEKLIEHRSQLTEKMETAVDPLDQNFDMTQTEGSTLRLVVEGITDMNVYEKIVGYLRRLPDIAQVELSEINPEKTIFHIESEVSRDNLAKTIAQGGMLTPLAEPHNKGTHTATLQNLVEEDPFASEAPLQHDLVFKVSEVP